MGCQPVSSRLITIRLKASSFNITIIQAYAPTTGYDHDDIEDFYDQLQEVIDQAPKKDIVVVQGDWNANIIEGASKNWKGTCGQKCNPEISERGLRLLEFASYNNLKVLNTLILVHTNHLDAGHGTAQETTTIRSTTSWSKEASSQVWTLQRPGAFQDTISEVWACNDDLQTPTPKVEKPGQHEDQVQSGETQVPPTSQIFFFFFFFFEQR